MDILNIAVFFYFSSCVERGRHSERERERERDVKQREVIVVSLNLRMIS